MVKNVKAAKRGLLILALGNRSTHLPTNVKCADYIQYVITNNHTIFGVFCFNAVHPLRYDVRIATLITTLAMSFALFNLLYYYFEKAQSSRLESFEEFLASTAGTTSSTGSLALALIGSPFLTIMDFLAWFYVALPCCLPGHTYGYRHGSRWISKYIVVFLAILVMSMTFNLVLKESTIATPTSGEFIGGGLLLFSITIFGLRILVTSILFFIRYPKDYGFYYEQYRKVTSGKEDGDDDYSEAEAGERDLDLSDDDSTGSESGGSESGSDYSSRSGSDSGSESGSDSGSESGSDSDSDDSGSESGSDYSSDES